MKILRNISPNFSKKRRSAKDIKFVIIHYLVNRKGQIINMVEDINIAWHAGKSKWKNFINLNSNSIGIELVNKGHRFGYQNFTKKQINSLLKLCKKLKTKYKIKNENFLGHSDIAPLRKIDPGEKFPWKKMSKNNIGKWYKETKLSAKLSSRLEKKFFKNLKLLGYRYFSLNKRSTKDIKIIRSFQQHYLPNNITGKIDQKTFKISQFLTH